MVFGLVKADGAWMVSPGARRRFLAAALLGAGGPGLLAYLAYLPGWGRVVAGSKFLLVAELAVAVATFMGITILAHGMLWYCVRLDRGRWYWRALWAVLFFFTVPLALIVYHFFVYRAQTAHRPLAG